MFVGNFVCVVPYLLNVCLIYCLILRLKWLQVFNLRCLSLLFVYNMCLYHCFVLAKGCFSAFYMYDLKLSVHSVVSYHYVLTIFCQFFIIFANFLSIFCLFGTVYGIY